MTYIVVIAFIIEAIFGYPLWLYAHILHPVVWMGAGISLLERHFNRPAWSEHTRRLHGIAIMIVLLAATCAVSALIGYIGKWAVLPVMATLFASRSLYDHVHAVYESVLGGHEADARAKVSHVVGHDVGALDQAGVCRAAIESLAESFSDAVVAPLFWAMCLGLPGVACYKLINTADNLLGHKDERYRAFGWAAAKLEDFANFLPSRISGVLIAAISTRHAAWSIMWRDAARHVSPNAGWPEAAMAGALRLQLGGPNTYDGVAHDAAYLGDGNRDAGPAHIARALSIYIKSCIVLWLVCLVIAVVQFF